MSESVNFVVAGKEFDLVKSGRDQAEQVVQLGKWINTYGIPALSSMMNDAGEISFTGGIDLLGDIISALSADALVDLFVVVLGCSKRFANEHFDVSSLIDAITIVYDEQPSISRLLARFFSADSSEESSEEPSTT